MLLIVGLGNPGEEYTQTNHNIGFRVVEKIANHFNKKFEKRIVCDSQVAKFSYGENEIVLAKPQTYMNLSGKAVKGLVKKYNINVKEELVVIADDFDIAEGSVRIRTMSGNTSHNGIKSIKQELGTNEFIRVKVAIGKKPEFLTTADFVLSKTRSEEAKKSEEKAAQAMIDLVSGDSLEKVLRNYSN